MRTLIYGGNNQEVFDTIKDNINCDNYLNLAPYYDGQLINLNNQFKKIIDLSDEIIFASPEWNDTYTWMIKKFVDDLGLDSADRRLLGAIIDNYNGGPVGVETLAALLSDERVTIEDYFEPYLLQLGLLERTPRGRKATSKAYRHMGKAHPDNSSQANLL